MENNSLRKYGPAIAWFFIATAALCLPGRDIPKVDNWFTKIHLDKWVHMGIFAIMAYLSMYPVAKSSISKRKKWIACIVIFFLTVDWGLATEFIQKYWVTGRDFDLWDWAADCAGALLALIVIRAKYIKHSL